MSARPIRERPFIAHREYGIPEAIEGALDWSEAVDRLARAPSYWIATAAASRPHVRPVWGVFLDDALYFGGGPETRWSRNLSANPSVEVHLESASEVVILEGSVARIDDPEDPRVRVVDDAYEAKYHMRHGIPFWELRPDRALAWTSFPTDATRWRF